MTRDNELPRGPSLPTGPAGRERWGYLVLGAVRALCLADGSPGPDAITCGEIVDNVYDEHQATLAIRRVVDAARWDRASAALRAIRDTNRMAGRPELAGRR